MFLGNGTRKNGKSSKIKFLVGAEQIKNQRRRQPATDVIFVVAMIDRVETIALVVMILDRVNRAVTRPRFVVNRNHQWSG